MSFYLFLCCFEITRCFFQSLFWQNILIELQHAIKANLRMTMNCQLYWNFAILHFFLDHISSVLQNMSFYLSLCCFEITTCFFQSLFWQNILIELQHVIKANQS